MVKVCITLHRTPTQSCSRDRQTCCLVLSRWRKYRYKLNIVTGSVNAVHAVASETQREMPNASHLSAQWSPLMHQLNDWAWLSNIDQLVPKTICTPRPDCLLRPPRHPTDRISRGLSRRAMLIYVRYDAICRVCRPKSATRSRWDADGTIRFVPAVRQLD